MLLCPYCAQEMQEGFLQSSGAILWTPEKADGIFRPDQDGFFLAKNLLRATPVPSHYCKYCRLLLTKRPEKKKR